MARNKYPQETVDKILDTAQRLFLTQGYEHTSIQDIIDGLGGLTRGAVYHHFKSKEDILTAVMDRMFQGKEAQLEAILAAPGLTGRERLLRTMQSSLRDPNQDQMFQAAPDLMANPRLLAMVLRDGFYDSVPRFLQPVVEQGVADGSITTDQPRELAQVLALLCNLWVNPSVCHGDQEEIGQRLRFLNTLLAPFGLDLFDGAMADKVLQYQEMYDGKNPGRTPNS